MLAIVSLVLSIVSLIVYVSVIERASPTTFVVSTAGAFVAGVVSLVLGLVAKKQIGQRGTESKGKLLVTMSIVVAVGYLVCVSIVMLNIVVQWVI